MNDHLIRVLHLPRRSVSVASAVYETTWQLVTAKFFLHTLDTLHAGEIDNITLELVALNGGLYICFSGSPNNVELMTHCIHAYFGAAEFRDVDDFIPNVPSENLIWSGTELTFERPGIYPIQTYKPFAYDSMAPIVSAFSTLAAEDAGIMQLVCSRFPDSVWSNAKLRAHRVMDRHFLRFLRSSTYLKRDVIDESLTHVKEKCSRRLWDVTLRIASWSSAVASGTRAVATTRARLDRNVVHIANALQIYNSVHENSFRYSPPSSSPHLFRLLRHRSPGKKLLMSSIEVTTLFHPPHLPNIPNSAQVHFKKSPPPALLGLRSDTGSEAPIAVTTYRSIRRLFGFPVASRRRHLYILGSPGTGKSCAIELLARHDLTSGSGCCVIDPHGDLFHNLTRFAGKMADEPYLFDAQEPISTLPRLNPLAGDTISERLAAVFTTMRIFRSIFSGSWNPALDFLLYQSLLGMVGGAPSISTLRRFLTDERSRIDIVKTSPVESARNYWLSMSRSQTKLVDATTYARLVALLDQLLSNPILATVLDTEGPALDVPSLLRQRRSILCCFAKGVLGDSALRFLGMLLLTKMMEAAQRLGQSFSSHVSPYHIYLDEAQNFLSPGFGELLNQAGGAGLSFTLAHQHLSQLDTKLRKVVFGTIPNLMVFRVGGEDAQALLPFFGSRFEAEDLMNAPLREVATRMILDNQIQEPFSAMTVELDQTLGNLE